jgi:hypothetical protein
MLNIATPLHKDVYELHLSVKSKIGVLHEITGFLSQQKIDIVSMHIQAARGSTADIVAFLEMEESKLTIHELLGSVRELDFVQEANAASKDKVVFEEFLFPLMVDEDVRGFLMTEGAWMSIATRLVLTYGTGGLAILHEAGVACGEEYAKQLQAKLGLRANPESAVENLEVMLRATGMGVVEISATLDGFLVKVEQPVIQATETKIYDHFLTGVISGAAGRLFATRYLVEAVRFEGDELRFTLARSHAERVAPEAHLPKAESAR